MGIPGMFTKLGERGVFQKRPFCHQAQGEFGPCVVFDDFTLPRLILAEWRRQPTESVASGPVRYNSRNGCWATQFRAFATCCIQQLVEEYHCTIVWIRDGRVNDKPSTMTDADFKDLAQGCDGADTAIRSTGGAANRGTLDTVSALRWPMKGFRSTNEAVLEAFQARGEGGWRDKVRVVNSAANCADGEVWRQAVKLLHRYGNKRRTFIVSCDTVMFFFRQSAHGVNVVLISSQKESHNALMIGAQWSCDLHQAATSNINLLRFTYCTITDDVAHALGVEPELLPVLAAYLGGDLSTYDPNVYNATVHIKSSIVDKHFEDGSPGAQAFKHLAHEVLKMKTRNRGAQECFNGKYCHNVRCKYAHPRDGSMWCREERAGDKQYCRPHCRFRHIKPMAFEIAGYTLEKYGVASKFPGRRAIFPTWGKAAGGLATMQEARKQSFLGVGETLPIGHGMRGNKDVRNIVTEETIDLVRTQGRWCTLGSGEIDVELFERNLCHWVRDLSGRDEHDAFEAFIGAVRVYDIPSLGEDAISAPVSTQIAIAFLSVVSPYRRRCCRDIWCCLRACKA